MFFGNDIIDLSYPDNIKSFKNLKYLHKFLTREELDFVSRTNMDYLPEIFWTCKESAYKIMVKKGLKNAFSPGKFLVEIISTSPVISRIIYNSTTLYGYSTYIKNQYVYTNASDDIDQDILWTSIESTRKDLLIKAAQKLCLPGNNLKIVKKNGIPVLRSNDLSIDNQISLSHDGKFHALVLDIK